jgi:polysaccharide biosynthesis protein PslH
LRVLVLDEEIPFPPNSGKRLRTYNLMKHLARKHEILWVSRQLESAAYNRSGFEALGIRTMLVGKAVRKKSGARFFFSLVGNTLSAYPYVVSSHRSKELCLAAKQTYQSQACDLIHCEWTPYAVNMPKSLSCPTIGMAHNVESVVWRRYQQIEQNPLKKLYLGLQADKMERFERQALPQFSRIISVSDQDKRIISQWVCSDHIAVVPNGVDIDFFERESGEEIPKSIIFIGSLDWRPNVDCVIYFLDEIWPLIKNSFPEAKFAVVGRNPLPRLASRIADEPAVTLHGSVEDVRPFINSAQVCIVPLRIGSGSRLKILEALAMEKPVVSTSVGAEGLDLENGRHVLIADNPADFADAVKRLFLNPAYRHSLALEGRQLAKEKYSWRILAEKLESEWQRTIQQ